jgi:hypothetical protein
MSGRAGESAAWIANSLSRGDGDIVVW